jgi:hypothetical protein
MAAFIRFHTQDSNGRPIGGAQLSATAPNHGPWAVQTNPCGDFFATLGPDVYTVTIAAPGYQTRVIPMNLADSGDILIGLESGSGPIGPFKPAPRYWKGNMCGVRIGGLPAIDGGAADPSLVLSWFYDRHNDADRATIRFHWLQRGYTHVLLSWPDSRAAGFSIEQFKATCEELIFSGFYPCVMLSSKDHDPADVTAITNGLMPVLNALVGVVPMFCMGWELSLWLSPEQVDLLIRRVAPVCLQQPGTLTYVHFQQGYPSFQKDGGTVADFWNQYQGLLTGLLYQKMIDQNDAQFLDSLKDCLERFAGGWGMVPGFDFVALELSAMYQYNGSMSEAQGDHIGTVAINAPKVNGVGVMGSGNGQQ